MSNPEPLAHHIGQRPSVGPAYHVPQMTRAEIEGAIHGHFAGSNPNSPAIIDKALLALSTLADIDKRRNSNGMLDEGDVREYETVNAAAASHLRQLGLYPASWKTPGHV